MTVRILIALLALAAAAAGVQTMRLHSLQTDVARAAAAQAEADRMGERAASQRIQEIDRATQGQIERDRRTAAADRSDLTRLRNAIAAGTQERATATTSCADERAAADRLASALDTCSVLVAEGVERGDSLAVQVSGLRSGAMPVVPAP